VSDLASFESVALHAARKAGALLRDRIRGAKRVEYKSGAVDLVTDTDRDAEALVVAQLRAAFPDHTIVAEEATCGTTLARPTAEQYAWYLDPLDGTTNFAHAFPHFCVSLALARGTEPLLGIVYDPMRDELFAARRGGGATLNGAPIGVSGVDDLERALLATGFPYDRRAHTDFYLSFVADFMQRAQGIRRGGSAALDLCYIACGRFDGFWEWKLRPWDTAAGTLIVREAGGGVSDFRGGAFDLFGEQALASNGHLHAALIEVLAQRLDRTRS